MSPRRILSVVGARPQFIKAAAVSVAIAAEPSSNGYGLEEILVHTGQHYHRQLSEVFFRDLPIPAPRHELNIGSDSHGRQTGAMLAAIEVVIIQERPDVVLVYGDTNTTLAGALAAAKLQVPVAHVEAGLRSGRRDMPEEINRILTDHAASLLFCPTKAAVANLRGEGIVRGVSLVGDVMYDVLLERLARGEGSTSVLDGLGVRPGAYAVATVHRAGNTDDVDRLRRIFEGFDAVAAQGVPVVVPLHPRTRARIADVRPSPDVHVIDPVSYDDMLTLQRNARIVLTDSGGVQKEAYWLGIPCVTLREETEWEETLQDDWNDLAGAEPERIARAATRDVPTAPRRDAFGDGTAARKIARILSTWRETNGDVHEEPEPAP